MTRIARYAAAALFLLTLPSHAALISYTTLLSGAAESPPNASPATGSATLDYDSVAHTLAISAIWTDLIGLTTAAHIHCCTAAPGTGTIGVAVTPGTLPGFPLGVTSGSYSYLLDLTDTASYTGAFLTGLGGGTAAGAESALIAGLDSGKAYFNIHTTAFPGGEIRGFPSAVPEPATFGLILLGIASLAWGRRKPA